MSPAPAILRDSPELRLDKRISATRVSRDPDFVCRARMSPVNDARMFVCRRRWRAQIRVIACKRASRPAILSELIISAPRQHPYVSAKMIGFYSDEVFHMQFSPLKLARATYVTTIRNSIQGPRVLCLAHSHAHIFLYTSNFLSLR